MKNGAENKIIDNVIVSLCADYERRKKYIIMRIGSKRLRMEFLYINKRLLEGAGEICGAGLAEQFIKDIGANVGYAFSEISELGESTYKRYKIDIKRNIAKKLYLIE